jgi:transposase
LVTSPAELRERYRRHSVTALVKALARCRPTSHGDPTTVAVLMAAKTLAQRVEFLTHQERELTAQLDVRVSELNPALRTAHGVGPDVAAQLLVTAGTNAHRLRNEAAFAALCGAAPVPASSGKTTRHRLSRGGDRAANSALHRIALVRMSNHGLAATSSAKEPRAAPRKRSCDCSNAPSPARSSDSSPGPIQSTTTPIFGLPAKPRTSPSPWSPTTSASL